MDEDILRLIALKSGLGLKYVSKNEKINALLEQIDRIFGDEVILKGGTAINKIYFRKSGIDRFSEDIDIDFIYHKKAKLDKRTDIIKKRINNIDGFEISRPRFLHRTMRFDLRYMNELGEKDIVRIEFYLSHDKALCIEPPKKRMLSSSFMTLNPVMFTSYALEDLMARKVIALYSRTEGKDIYDVYHCLNLEYDPKKFMGAMNLMLDFYKIESDSFLRSLIEKLRNADKNYIYIQNSTNHYIPTKLRPDWKIMIRELIEKLEEGWLK